MGACVKKGRQIISKAGFQRNRNLQRQSIKERRKTPRFDLFFAMPTLKSIHQIAGHEVALINISRRGALIESREQIPSGSSIVLRIVTAETVYIIKGRITRCNISPTNDRIFQSGIAFDEEFTFLPVSVELLKLFESDKDVLK